MHEYKRMIIIIDYLIINIIIITLEKERNGAILPPTCSRWGLLKECLLCVVPGGWQKGHTTYLDHYIRNNNIKADGAKMNGVIAHWSKEIGHTKKNKSDKSIFMKSVFLFFFVFFNNKRKKTGKWTNPPNKKPDGQERPVEGLKTRKGYYPKKKSNWTHLISISWPRILYTSTNL